MSKLESEFQSEVIKEIKTRLPECIVMKNDPDYIQGIPDLTILYNKKWATLECKRTNTSPRRPNQEYYVNKMNGMSFSRFISPENKEEVLDDLQRTLQANRSTRISGSK